MLYFVALISLVFFGRLQAGEIEYQKEIHYKSGIFVVDYDNDKLSSGYHLSGFPLPEASITENFSIIGNTPNIFIRDYGFSDLVFWYKKDMQALVLMFRKDTSCSRKNLCPNDQMFIISGFFIKHKENIVSEEEQQQEIKQEIIDRCDSVVMVIDEDKKRGNLCDLFDKRGYKIDDVIIAVKSGNTETFEIPGVLRKK